MPLLPRYATCAFSHFVRGRKPTRHSFPRLPQVRTSASRAAALECLALESLALSRELIDAALRCFELESLLLETMAGSWPAAQRGLLAKFGSDLAVDGGVEGEQPGDEDGFCSTKGAGGLAIWKPEDGVDTRTPQDGSPSSSSSSSDNRLSGRDVAH